MEMFNYTSKGKQKMIGDLIKEADKELMKYKQSFVESGYEIATQKRAQIQGQRAERKISVMHHLLEMQWWLM